MPRPARNFFGGGGREKSLTALCRKIALAPEGGTIEIWGDGEQTWSFLYIDDCLEAMLRLTRSDWTGQYRLRGNGFHQCLGPVHHGHCR